MMLRILITVSVLFLAGAAYAQAVLPFDNEETSTPQASDTSKPAKHAPKHAKSQGEGDDATGTKEAKKEEPDGGVASIIGKTLKLNGTSGEMEIDKGDGKSLRIISLKLAGEVISDSAQKCEISIVAEGPIPALSDGAPDGLPRFAADVPACPLSFDVVGSGVIVPPQTQACVFKAADCQASPSGVWGPNAIDLGPQWKTLAKDRSRAEASITDSLKSLSKRSKGEADELAKEESDFNALRNETCRNYQDEANNGFCDARMTQARAALLHKQVAKAPPKEKEKHKE